MPISAEAAGIVRRTRNTLAVQAAQLLQAAQGIPITDLGGIAWKGSTGRKRALARILAQMPEAPLILQERVAVWRFLQPVDEPLIVGGSDEDTVMVRALVIGLARGEHVCKSVSWGMAFTSHSLARLLQRTDHAANLVQVMLEAHDTALGASAECAGPFLQLYRWAMPAGPGAFISNVLPLDNAGEGIVLARCATWIGTDQLWPEQVAQVAAFKHRKPGRTLGNGLLLPAPLRAELRTEPDTAGCVSIAVQAWR